MTNSETLLGLPNYQITGITREGAEIRIAARYTGPLSCPHCSGSRLRDKGRYLRRVRHENWGLRRCVLLLEGHKWRCFGADYIANILRQQQVRREVQPPLRFQDPALNELATDPLSLAEYDAFILRSRKESRDLATPETESTQPDDHEPPTGAGDLGGGGEKS